MDLTILKPILAMGLAGTIWGLSGIFYAQLTHIAPLEVLAHRSLWAMAFFCGVLAIQGRLYKLIRNQITVKQVLLLGASAGMISINWFSFIFAIQSGQAIQASFGYYVFPLVAVVFGYLFKGERFSKVQLVAIVFASISVVSLGFALRLVPLLALIIAVTFGAYGLIKGFTRLGSTESVAIETLIISPFSLAFLYFIYFSKVDGDYSVTNIDLVFLVMSGLLTGGPLILFSYATKKLNYATVGILQYINPTLQFFVAIFIFTEGFNIWHAFALTFIWIGIVIYSAESWRLGLRR